MMDLAIVDYGRDCIWVGRERKKLVDHPLIYVLDCLEIRNKRVSEGNCSSFVRIKDYLYRTLCIFFLKSFSF